MRCSRDSLTVITFPDRTGASKDSGSPDRFGSFKQLVSSGAFGSKGDAWNSGFSGAAFTGYEKPKAVLRPKRTALENKPYIAKGIGGLDSVNGLQKGAAKADSLEYGVGDRVRHLKYGDGTVTNIVDGPRDYQVTVQFDGPGQKIMYAAFAKLKKI